MYTSSNYGNSSCSERVFSLYSDRNTSKSNLLHLYSVCLKPLLKKMVEYNPKKAWSLSLCFIVSIFHYISTRYIPLLHVPLLQCYHSVDIVSQNYIMVFGSLYLETPIWPLQSNHHNCPSRSAH